MRTALRDVPPCQGTDPRLGDCAVRLVTVPESDNVLPALTECIRDILMKTEANAENAHPDALRTMTGRSEGGIHSFETRHSQTVSDTSYDFDRGSRSRRAALAIREERRANRFEVINDGQMQSNGEWRARTHQSKSSAPTCPKFQPEPAPWQVHYRRNSIASLNTSA